MMPAFALHDIEPETMNPHALRLLFASLLLATGLMHGPCAHAQTGGDVDCSIARDPARCEAHQAALAACADQRGKAKTACLAEHMPPVDCSKASNPANCAAAERAKQACGGKQGKALKACLHDAGGDKANGAVAKKKKAAKKPRRTERKKAPR